jgi:exopolysaccharide biosynthesis polyprenyl glycosylphosphotransferase
MEFIKALIMTHHVPVSTNVHIWRLHPNERRYLLIFGDFFMAIIALFIALYFWAVSHEWLGWSLDFLQERPPLWFYLFPIMWLILLVDLYDVDRASTWGQTVKGVVRTALIGLIVYLGLYFYFTDPPASLLPRRGVAAFLLAASLLTLSWRYLYIRVFTAPRFMRRFLILGAGKSGQTLLKIIKDIWPPPFHLIGIIDDDVDKIGKTIENQPVIAGSDRLMEIVAQEEISDILVAISGELQGKTFQTLLDVQERGVRITRMPVVYEELLGRVPIRLLEADWILRSFAEQNQARGFYEIGKRGLDIIGGMIGVAIFIFTLPIISFAIFLDSGRPIFYSQTRSGRGAVPYTIFKYRTMQIDAEPDGIPLWAKEDDERATRVGKFLRKTHLDELPQFLNVLRGEMSIVGPRAERPELVDMFQQHVPFYRARLLVKPGMTGWAQVNFGYASTVDETVIKLEYDLYYVKHRNLLMDLTIMFRTPATVFGFRGQ